jgi:hypothetical protein
VLLNGPDKGYGSCIAASIQAFCQIADEDIDDNQQVIQLSDEAQRQVAG